MRYCDMFISVVLFFAVVTAVSCDGSSSTVGTNADADTAAVFEGAEEDTSGSDTDTAVSCEGTVFEDISIPMRDGKTLSAFVRRREDPRCAQPVVLVQTPYDKDVFREMYFSDVGAYPLFSDERFSVVVVDWRGFHGSSDAATEDMSETYGLDGYDTVEWIAEQDWCDGTIGTWGVSALCVQQYRTAVEQPPHLAAMVPIFCQMNTTYEQYYTGGVLKQEYYDFIQSYYGGGVVKDYPYRDAVWQWAGTQLSHADVTVPLLIVSGWHDLHNVGTISDFKAFTKLDADDRYLLIGDWIHVALGGAVDSERYNLDEREMTYTDRDAVIATASHAFFVKTLLGKSSQADTWPPVRYSIGGTDGTLRESVSWPPDGISSQTLHPAADGTLSETQPAADTVTIPCDPDDPSPTRGGATLRLDLDHGPRFQDDVVSRSDIQVFTGAPLSEDLTIIGIPALDIDCETTAADSDIAIRITDVDPDGQHLLVADGIWRMKLSESLASPDDTEPGTTHALHIPASNEIAYRFPAGHRIGLILSGTNYPRFARNPGTGDDFYEDAENPSAYDITCSLDENAVFSIPVSED